MKRAADLVPGDRLLAVEGRKLTYDRILTPDEYAAIHKTIQERT